ncbi:polyprenyl synthetase family protein [Gracilibacillus thailandensis]|uniref:polyprenyl synthetase family protein n=1 Tax=Gracilibacillus thailandensis TaxID=563735 RepID=UPI002B4AD625|nr:polyprenyl synthetase family protein [Gracilibacillus thailandensis]
MHYNAFKSYENDENIHLTNKFVQKLILSFDIFDDVQDKDNKRAPWSGDERQAINLGLILLIDAFKEAHECNFINKKTALDYIHLNLSNSIKGQYIDIQNRIKTPLEYINMCKSKSGSLVSLAALLGVLTTSTKHLTEIHSYCLDIGVAAQISNDIKDVINFEKKNDLSEKKISLPILYLLYQYKGPSMVKDYFLGLVDYKEICMSKSMVIRQLYHSGALNYAKQVKEKYMKQAKEKVNNLPIGSSKKLLIIKNLIDEI